MVRKLITLQNRPWKSPLPYYKQKSHGSPFTAYTNHVFFFKGFCLVNKPMGLPSESFTWQNRALGWLDFCSYGRPGTIPKTILKNNYLIFKPNYFIVLNK
jgi:hypothetical protein